MGRKWWMKQPKTETLMTTTPTAQQTTTSTGAMVGTLGVWRTGWQAKVLTPGLATPSMRVQAADTLQAELQSEPTPGQALPAGPPTASSRRC
ncbi:uncharacterized protein LOC126412644 isoform X8 [Schistocerca serialis cubense]|uniref:uncharacterized protein LOC126412644 isoform X8 n=1 Tax=Schistocerca serialis cubense TaxID=2023355 RepID=UPI00214F2218|nr:uncharacterized protein LOC126412644 isoform X8 [Schistocerca serialis cubense]